MLKIREAYKLLGSIIEDLDDNENPVLVVTTNDSTVGPTPATMVKSIFSGFDWDRGRILIDVEDKIYTEKELRRMEDKKRKMEELKNKRLNK